MRTHTEKAISNYSKAQLFELIIDVNSYPKFLPWCTAAKVTAHKGNLMHADLVIGYKHFKEKFTSKIELQPNDRIDTYLQEGVFKNLHSCWKFIDLPDGTTEIDFYIEFKFKNIILEKLIGSFFEYAVKKMVTAFKQRADELYSK